MSYNPISSNAQRSLPQAFSESGKMFSVRLSPSSLAIIPKSVIYSFKPETLVPAHPPAQQTHTCKSLVEHVLLILIIFPQTCDQTATVHVGLSLFHTSYYSPYCFPHSSASLPRSPHPSLPPSPSLCFGPAVPPSAAES